MSKDNLESSFFGSFYLLRRFDQPDDAKKQAEVLADLYRDLWFMYQGTEADLLDFHKTHSLKYKVMTGVEPFFETIEPTTTAEAPQYVAALKYPFTNDPDIIEETSLQFAILLKKLESSSFNARLDLMNNFGTN